MLVDVIVKIIFGLVALFLWLRPTAAISQSRSELGPIKIGAVLALTGPAARWGTDARRSMELAKSALEPQDIELVIEDSGTKASQGVSAFKKLIESDKVQAVVGDVWTHLTIPLIPLAARAGAVVISPSVVPASIQDPESHFFTLGFKPENAQGALELFFNLHPEIRTVSVLCWDDPWGDVYTKVWLKIIQERKLQVLEKLCTNDYGHDYRTEAARISLRQADALLIAYHHERVLKLLRQRHYFPRILSTSNILEVLRTGALPWESAQQSYYTDWPPPADFEARFRERFGEFPSAEGFNAYDAVFALVEAIRLNPSDVLTSLKTMKRAGLAGPIDFSGGFAANYAQASLMKVSGTGVERVN